MWWGGWSPHHFSLHHSWCLETSILRHLHTRIRESILLSNHYSRIIGQSPYQSRVQAVASRCVYKPSVIQLFVWVFVCVCLVAFIYHCIAVVSLWGHTPFPSTIAWNILFILLFVLLFIFLFVLLFILLFVLLFVLSFALLFVLYFIWKLISGWSDHSNIYISKRKKKSAKECFTFYFQYSESLDRRRQLDSLTVTEQKNIIR